MNLRLVSGETYLVSRFSNWIADCSANFGRVTYEPKVSKFVIFGVSFFFLDKVKKIFKQGAQKAPTYESITKKKKTCKMILLSANNTQSFIPTKTSWLHQREVRIRGYSSNDLNTSLFIKSFVVSLSPCVPHMGLRSNPTPCVFSSV